MQAPDRFLGKGRNAVKKAALQRRLGNVPRGAGGGSGGGKSIPEQPNSTSEKSSGGATSSGTPGIQVNKTKLTTSGPAGNIFTGGSKNIPEKPKFNLNSKRTM